MLICQYYQVVFSKAKANTQLWVLHHLALEIGFVILPALVTELASHIFGSEIEGYFWVTILCSLAALVLLVVCVFLWNLISVPARIDEDKEKQHACTVADKEKEISSLKIQISVEKKLNLAIETETVFLVSWNLAEASKCNFEITKIKITNKSAINKVSLDIKLLIAANKEQAQKKMFVLENPKGMELPINLVQQAGTSGSLVFQLPGIASGKESDIGNFEKIVKLTEVENFFYGKKIGACLRITDDVSGETVYKEINAFYMTKLPI